MAGNPGRQYPVPLDQFMKVEVRNFVGGVVYDLLGVGKLGFGVNVTRYLES